MSSSTSRVLPIPASPSIDLGDGQLGPPDFLATLVADRVIIGPNTFQIRWKMEPIGLGAGMGLLMNAAKGVANRLALEGLHYGTVEGAETLSWWIWPGDASPHDWDTGGNFMPNPFEKTHGWLARADSHVVNDPELRKYGDLKRPWWPPLLGWPPRRK